MRLMRSINRIMAKNSKKTDPKSQDQLLQAINLRGQYHQNFAQS